LSYNFLPLIPDGHNVNQQKPAALGLCAEPYVRGAIRPGIFFDVYVNANFRPWKSLTIFCLQVSGATGIYFRARKTSHR